MSCGKINNTCLGNKINSRCVDYDGELKRSSLKEGCTNINDTTEELYSLVDWLYLNTTEIDIVDNCFLPNGKYNANELFDKYGKEICKLNSITANVDYNTIVKNLDKKCLTTPCGEEITTITELFQSIINKICDNGQSV
jgi:hypothetical protein